MTQQIPEKKNLNTRIDEAFPELADQDESLEGFEQDLAAGMPNTLIDTRPRVEIRYVKPEQGAIRDLIFAALTKHGAMTPTETLAKLPALNKQQVFGSMYNSARSGNLDRIGDKYQVNDRTRAIMAGETVEPIGKASSRATSSRMINIQKARAAKAAKREAMHVDRSVRNFLTPNGSASEDLGTLFEAVGLDSTGEMVVRSVESKKLYRLSAV